jgi:RNA polymerase sigma-70 factor (ECF subfamily)
MMQRWDADSPASLEDVTLDQARALDRFLSGVEKRAYRIARIAVRNDDDALDIVQDAMLQLARHYSARPSEQWRPLFYRILQNRIGDWRRRSKFRSRFLAWLPASGEAGERDPVRDLVESAPDGAPTPAQHIVVDEAMRTLEEALAALPHRQQQAFMLRNFEGLNVAQTASAMGCSEGSVKTHYSRAVHALRARLGEVW